MHFTYSKADERALWTPPVVKLTAGCSSVRDTILDIFTAIFSSMLWFLCTNSRRPNLIYLCWFWPQWTPGQLWGYPFIMVNVQFWFLFYLHIFCKLGEFLNPLNTVQKRVLNSLEKNVSLFRTICILRKYEKFI